MLLLRTRHHRRKLYLPPGYIALSLFVWVASLSVLKHEIARFERVLEVGYMKDLSGETTRCLKIITEAKIQVVQDEELFKKQIGKIKQVLEFYQKSNNENTIISFTVSDSMKWNNIVQLIDLGVIYNCNTYFENENKLVFNGCRLKEEKTAERIREEICGSAMIHSYEAYLKWKPKADELQKQADAELVSLISPFFLPHAFLLLLIGIISYRKLRHQNT